MPPDPILAEIRKQREAYAARWNYDLVAICADLRKRQAECGRKVVSLQRKEIQPRRASKDQPAA
jgi:hypothetical protein